MLATSKVLYLKQKKLFLHQPEIILHHEPEEHIFKLIRTQAIQFNKKHSFQYCQNQARIKSKSLGLIKH